MTVLFNAGEWSAPMSQGVAKTRGENLRSVLSEMLGGVVEGAALVLAGGVATTPATAHGGVFAIDVETGTEDDCDTISFAGIEDGRLFLVHAVSAARVIVLKHGTGNLSLRDTADFGLDKGAASWVLFKRTGATAVEVVRSENLDPEVRAMSGAGLTLKHWHSGDCITNEGAAASRTAELPSARAGLTFLFAVREAQNLVVQAAAGDTIRVAAGVSSAGGTATNGTVGGTLLLVAINATEWIAFAVNGTWTLA